MTDKSKELVARMRHAVANPMKTWSAGEVIAADKVDFWADELEALLAEQAPAGEFDARALAKAWLEHAHGEEPCEVPGGQSEDSDVDCLAFQFRKAYAAGRLSQPVEPRDPAAK